MSFPFSWCCSTLTHVLENVVVTNNEVQRLHFMSVRKHAPESPGEICHTNDRPNYVVPRLLPDFQHQAQCPNTKKHQNAVTAVKGHIPHLLTHLPEASDHGQADCGPSAAASGIFPTSAVSFRKWSSIVVFNDTSPGSASKTDPIVPKPRCTEEEEPNFNFSVGVCLPRVGCW